MVKKIEHKFEDGIELKYCGSCKIYKELKNFNINNSSWDKLRTTCKDCIKIQRKSWKESTKTMENRRNNHYEIDGILGKKCSDCTEWKSLITFTNSKNNWDKLDRVCKDCDKQKRIDTSDKIKEYKIENKERFAEYNKEYQKQYRENNKDKLKESSRKYYIDNHDIVRKKQNNRNKLPDVKKKNLIRRQNYLNTNLNAKIAHYQRTRINKVLKKNKKVDRTIELLGCTIQFLKDYIEEKFQENMSWENYGEWHIDHIKPCVSFNLSIEEEQYKCFNYTNLQPLWKFDNLSKGSKYINNFEDEYRYTMLYYNQLINL